MIEDDLRRLHADQQAQARVLAQWRDDPTPLLDILHHSGSSWLRALAADALALTGEYSAITPLLTALDDPDDMVAGHAAQALATLTLEHPQAAPQVVSAAASLLARPNIRLRWAAAEALADLGPLAAPALPALLDAWAEGEQEAYIDTLTATMLAAGEAGTPYLKEALQHQDEAIRRQAGWLLAQLSAEG